MREATALVERAEITVPNVREPIVVGFRRDGSCSLFFGTDPVYQFNSYDELRRAYCDGTLIKAVQGKLVRLRRERRDNQVQLLSARLNDNETARLLRDLTGRTNTLHNALTEGTYSLKAQIPADGRVLERMKGWLATSETFRIANAPNAK